MKGKRRSIADDLKKAGAGYLLKKGFSSHFEVGLCSWGKLRADVLAFNYKLQFILLEIKSCLADFRTDTKWEKYSDFANKVYFVMTKTTAAGLKDQEITRLKKAGFGLLVLQDSGFLKVEVNARLNKMQGKIKKEILVRIAWRCGTNRSNSRRTKVFINEIK
jgi:hypothetical protein